MSGNARRLAEAANQIMNPQSIAEAFKAGDKVKVPHKGKMVSGKIVRYDDGGTSKARQSGGGYVVDVGEPASILVPKQNVQKEEAEQIDEVRRATKDADAYVGKRVFIPASPAAERRHKEEDSKKPGEIWTTKPDSFGQTRVGAKNLDGFVRYFRSGMEPTAKKWAKKRETWKQVPFFKDDPYKEEVVTEAEWKSLKKTKVDLNALRKQGYKISVQHGEGDTLYKITGKPSKPAMKKESAEITEAPYTPANDYEGEMAMTQLKSIMEKANDVLGMLKPEAKMEAWVQSKITLADEYISTVRDYLKHTDGAIG